MTKMLSDNTRYSRKPAAQDPQQPTPVHMAGLPYHPNNYPGNMTLPSQPAIIVRAEEALIVILVLVLWVGAIALFFNRWGKIRMLEPYQPKFIQQHRPSCPMVDQVVQNRSFSKFNINGDAFLTHQNLLRPRQNSVFVGSSMVTLPINPPRKVKSAFDLQNLVLSDPAIHTLHNSMLRPDDLRRCSMLPTFNISVDALRRGSMRPSTDERRLSFKDVTEIPQRYEKVQCYMEREPCDKKPQRVGECRQSQELKISDRQDRRASMLPQCSRDINLPQCSRDMGLPQSIRELDVNELRADTKSGVTGFRRNSMMLINSLETDRGLLAPRFSNDNFKSGVVDFRRNSMLIINNLTEDVGVPTMGRNFSLGGSNVALGEFAPTARRNSVIPPYAVPKVQCSAPTKTKQTRNTSSCVDAKYISHHKGSKSLDSDVKKKIAVESPPISELRKQFLLPVMTDSGALTSSLTDVCYGESGEETGGLSRVLIEAPRIIETRCCSPNPEDLRPDRYSSQTNLISNEEGAKEPVNLTSSLSNINITSSIPLNVITCSDVTKKRPCIQMSHV